MNRQLVFLLDDKDGVDDESRVLPKLRIDTILPLPPPNMVDAIMVAALEVLFRDQSLFRCRRSAASEAVVDDDILLVIIFASISSAREPTNLGNLFYSTL